MPMGCYYGKPETWKVVYYANANSYMLSTALVEADSRQMAIQVFREQYSGQYRTIQDCRKLLG